jgi:hypothetical protein
VRRVVVLAFLIPALAGCGADDDPSVEVTVTLPDKNGSGIFGAADVTRLDDTHVRIDVTLEGALPERDLPAYVILGGCSSFEPEVEHELKPVADGASSTEIGLPMAEITTGSYALAVGSTDPMKYVACGDLVP